MPSTPQQKTIACKRRLARERFRFNIDRIAEKYSQAVEEDDVVVDLCTFDIFASDDWKVEKAFRMLQKSSSSFSFADLSSANVSVDDLGNKTRVAKCMRLNEQFEAEICKKKGFEMHSYFRPSALIATTDSQMILRPRNSLQLPLNRLESCELPRIPRLALLDSDDGRSGYAVRKVLPLVEADGKSMVSGFVCGPPQPALLGPPTKKEGNLKRELPLSQLNASSTPGDNPCKKIKMAPSFKKADIVADWVAEAEKRTVNQDFDEDSEVKKPDRYVRQVMAGMKEKSVRKKQGLTSFQARKTTPHS